MPPRPWRLLIVFQHQDHGFQRPASRHPSREKLLTRGASALSDAELLAILLRTGLAGCSVLQLAQSLLDSFEGLAGLLNASAQDLQRIKGLGPAKRAEMLAVMELAQARHGPAIA